MLYNLSIIIPVYNASRYIMHCLESVSRQTLHNIEVIVVDDHGQDNSIDLVQSFADKSERDDLHLVLISTPKNSGPGVARNMGLRSAKGEYVAFLDADDWVEPDMYEQLYTNAVKYNAELSCCAAILDYDNGTKTYMYNPKIESGKLDVEKKKYILCRYISNFTTFIYLRKWMSDNNLIFPDATSGEDSCFMGCCYLSVCSIAWSDEVLYHYRIHNDSISHNKKIWRGAEKRKAFDAMLKFAKANGYFAIYKWQLYFVYFKKALLTPVLEYLR